MGSGEAAPDTIAAVATPPGRGGIGIVRVSGPLAADVARAVIGRLPAPRRAVRAEFRDAAGNRIDEGLALYFPAPNSYTGESVLELQGHGGPVVMHLLLDACLAAGARLAQPGEFTRRAFLRGKVDLAQAEGVADLIDAASAQAARSAMRSLTGEFSSAVRAIVTRLTDLRALIEAMLDFPEEEIDSLHVEEANRLLSGLEEELGEVLNRSRQGTLLSSGLRVVIAGAPNVGKSSLLNRLAGEERAIVTPIAGTTRDALRESIHLDGIPVTLVDTAGLRQSGDQIEILGMERTRQELGVADIVLLVQDAGGLPEAISPELPAGAVRIDVYNKADLAPSFSPPAGGSRRVVVSALTGSGLQELRQAILQAAGWNSIGETAFLARKRHVVAMQHAVVHVREARMQSRDWEFRAEELRLAQAALAEITGEISSDELLGQIFSRFCIGK